MAKNWCPHNTWFLLDFLRPTNTKGVTWCDGYIDVINVILTLLGGRTQCCPLGEMYPNGIEHHDPLDDPDSFIILLLIVLYCLAWFYVYKFYIYLPISAHGLWEWCTILTLFAWFTYVNVLYWKIRFYYYGFLVNAGLCLILVLQIFLLVYYIVRGRLPNIFFCVIHYCSFYLLKSHYAI